MDFDRPKSVPVTIHTASMYSLGVGTRAVAASSAGFVSLAWGTANLAIFTPFFLPFRYPVKNMFVYNFATVAGNVDVGIYSSDLTKVTPTVNVAQAGASTLQFFPMDIVLDPGQYYFALAASSTTATYGSAGSISATRLRYFGCFQQTLGALPLPTTATPVAIASGRIPAMGMTNVSGTPTF